MYTDNNFTSNFLVQNVTNEKLFTLVKSLIHMSEVVVRAA